MKKIAALVVARAGSKSIPRKNVQPVAGKPLIVHTFEAARACPLLDRVLVSTDDSEVAELALRQGVEVPFMRPAELAGDASPVMDATLHALRWLEENEHYAPDYVLLLQPTSPLRTAQDIEASIRLALDRSARAVVSVTPAENHPYQLKKMDEQGVLSPWMESNLSGARRQDLPPVYALNGAIYLVRREVLLEEKTWCPQGALAYTMPPERSLDMDTPWDLKLAGLLLAERNKGGT